MYFQRRKNAIQVFAVRGYDPRKRRSIIRYLGSIFLDPPRPDEKLLLSLRDEEKEELKSYLNSLVLEEFTRQKLNQEEQVIFAFREAFQALLRFGESESVMSRESINAIREILADSRACLTSISRRKKKQKDDVSAPPLLLNYLVSFPNPDSPEEKDAVPYPSK